MKMKELLIFSALSTASVSVQAITINFANMANGAWGESAWTTLAVSGVSITSTFNGADAFTYLDRNTGGLGACQQLNAAGTAALNTMTGSGANLCDPSNDDNMAAGETLHLVFGTDVTIDTLWFNNFHDGDQSLFGDNISIGGNAYTFTNGDNNTSSSTLAPYTVLAGEIFEIGYIDEKFYLEAMTFSPVVAVSAPATLALMGIGLMGFAGMRRRTAK